MKKEKTGWLKASILILIWTIYYYAKRYTGGLVDDMDNIVCGLTGFICIFIIIKYIISFILHISSKH